MVSDIEEHEQQALELLRAEKREKLAGRCGHDEAGDQALRDLRAAIDAGWYTIYLQPKADAHTGALGGAEALVRLCPPGQGVIPPSKFIPAMEINGLVRFIDLFVLEEVAKLIARWQAKGQKVFPISLNFSRQTMLEPGIVDELLRTIKRHHISPEQIEIEITETFGELEYETMLSIGNAIRDAGFRLSLDDFGARYSNLSILSAVRFSAVKLDRSMMRRILSNDFSRAVVRRIAELCEDFNVDCVAEGIETEEQLEAVRALGCRYIQGYIINKPLPVNDFEAEYFE